MGASKVDQFSTAQNELARLTKALGHPARIAILQYIVKTKACVCGDIVGELPLSQSTVSQHLKELKQAGLIQGTIEGTSVCYCINEVNWKKAEQLLSQMFHSYNTRQECC